MHRHAFECVSNMIPNHHIGLLYILYYIDWVATLPMVISANYIHTKCYFFGNLNRPKIEARSHSAQVAHYKADYNILYYTDA